MKARSLNLVWGLALVAAGLVWLAQNMGWIGEISAPVWIGLFAALSLLFFASYFINGTDQWGWLFPAMIFGGLAITVSLDEAGMKEALVGAPIFVGIGAPFVVAYLQDRSRWWALIPAWVMAVLVLVMAIDGRMADELVGMVVLWGIAVPFAVVYLMDRSKKWALIPAGILGTVGLIPPLSMGMSEDMMGPVVLFLFSLAFFVVYFMSSQNWWALIPAGIFATIGVALLVIGPSESDLEGSSRFAGLLFLGWALTFLALWLRRASAPVEWAKYPALALAVIGVVGLALGSEALRLVWPVAIIGAGVLMLWGSFRQQKR